MSVEKNIIIFDLDGTLALIGHRVHHITSEKPDWTAFYTACADDLPNSPIITVEFIPLSFWYDTPLTSQYSDRRHDPWQVYGSPSCSPARWSSWISRA